MLWSAVGKIYYNVAYYTVIATISWQNDNIDNKKYDFIIPSNKMMMV